MYYLPHDLHYITCWSILYYNLKLRQRHTNEKWKHKEIRQQVQSYTAEAGAELKWDYEIWTPAYTILSVLSNHTEKVHPHPLFKISKNNIAAQQICGASLVTSGSQRIHCSQKENSQINDCIFFFCYLFKEIAFFSNHNPKFQSWRGKQSLKIQ